MYKIKGLLIVKITTKKIATILPIYFDFAQTDLCAVVILSEVEICGIGIDMIFYSAAFLNVMGIKSLKLIFLPIL